MVKSPMKNKTSKKSVTIIQAIIGLCFGGGLALTVMPHTFSQVGYETSILLTELTLFLNLFLAIPMYIFVIALHEAGHLLAGLISGYKFVSYRILNLMLIAIDGKLKLKIYSLAGTAGQCLLKPPVWKEDGIPARLYNLGGILLNLLCAVFALPFCFILPLKNLSGMLVTMFVVINVHTVLINGIPMNNNDGDNVLHLSKDKDALRAFYNQIRANALLAEGVALADMPDDLYEISDDADINNPLIAANLAYQSQMYLYHHDFDRADKEIEKVLEKTKGSLLPVIRMLLINERIFYEMLHENRSDVIEGFKDKEFLKYQKAMQSNPSIIRVKYTEALISKDEKTINKCLMQMNKVAKSYPYKQEIDEEKYLMRLAKERFEM